MLNSLKACSHVRMPKFGPKFDPLKFNIVTMVTGQNSGRMGVGPILHELTAPINYL